MALKKTSAEYFSHDADASEDEKVMYLEAEFGFMGYALYFKMLERLCRSSNFEMKFGPVQRQVLARHFGVSVDEFSRFVVAATSCDVAAFRLENETIWSDGLKKRMAHLMEKRQRDAERIAQKRAENAQKIHNSLINEGVAATSAQVKERKGKESKVKESKGSVSAHAHAQAVEVEVLQPLPSPAMHEFVNAQTPDELESKISKFYTAWPNLKEWIESTTVAGQMGPQDRTDVVRGFCSYAIEKGYGRKTFQDLHARFAKWWNDQKNFNRASANGKPANGKQNGLKFNSPDTISDAFEFAARWQRETELGLPH